MLFNNNNNNKNKPKFNWQKNKKGFDFKNVIIGIMFIIVLLSLPQIFSNSAQKRAQEIDYTTFLHLLDEKKVVKIVEMPPYITADVKAEAEDDETYKVKLVMLTNRIGHDKNLMDKIKQSASESPIIVVAKEPDTSYPWMATIISWLPMLLLVAAWIYMLRQANKNMGGGSSGPTNIFSVGKSNARVNENRPKVTFDDVAGVEEAKEELKEVVEFLKSPAKFLKMGAKIPRGVLLLGAPGSGKTLLAKAVAGEAKVPFFNISGSEFVEMFVGVGASRVRDLFSKAKKSSPCIVFIDEIDAVGRQRGSGLGGGNDEREQTLNQLLVEMDGFETDQNVVIIAATNRPDVLDKAIMRPGRFDRQVVVDMPSLKDREDILKVHAKGKPFVEGIDLKVIARKTPGFVGADLENILNEAAILAARHNKEAISMHELEEAVERVVAGPQRKSKIMSDKEKEIVAYHESGHALVSWVLPNTDPVHKISIIPRGHSALGYTLRLPEEDKFLISKEYLINTIKVLLAGRGAEKLKFKEITSGCSDDIKKATQIARNMVMKYGMSDNFAPITLGKEESGFFLGREIGTVSDYSDETAKAIDDEINHIVDRCNIEVTRLLNENVDKLEKMADYLLKNEEMSGSDIASVVA